MTSVQINNPLPDRVVNDQPVNFITKVPPKTIAIPNVADNDPIVIPLNGPLTFPSMLHVPPEPINIYEKLSREDQLKHKRLQFKIESYFHVFAKYLSNETAIEYEYLSIEELTNKLEDIKYLVGCRNTSGAMSLVMKRGFGVLEGQITMITGINVDNTFANMLEDSPEIEDIVNEVVLEYQDLIYVNPAYRLLTIYGLNILDRYKMGKLLNACNSLIQKPVLESLIHKYSEL